MRLGFDGRELLRDNITGIGRFLSGFLKHAVKIKPTWKFILFGNQYTCSPFDNTNVKKVIIPETSSFLWDHVTLSRSLKKENIDLFFSPYYKAPMISPCSKIVTIHDVIPFVRYKKTADSHGKALFSRRKYRLNPAAKAWVKVMAGGATKIITVSHYSKKDIVNFLGIPENKIEVVYEGVDEEFRPQSADRIEKAKEYYGIEGHYLLYVGNTEPHKNVDGVLEAYAALHPMVRKTYKLVIAGKKGPALNRLKEASRRLGIENKSLFPGFIRGEDLPALYSGADIFLFPSFYEGFGLPPLEAMACGAPVISARRACIPEILKDAALLVDPSDPREIAKGIESIAACEDLREELREKGLKRAGDFSLSEMSRTMLEIFESACA